MDLKGKRILVTRAKVQASALVTKIENYGGIPVEMPLISCKQVEDLTILHSAIGQLHQFQWLIFTSKNGIDFFFKQLKKMKKHLPSTCKIAVVGKKTEEFLAEYGLKADLLPKEYVAESLLESLLQVLQKGDRILIPRGNLARNIIPNQLRENGFEVMDVTIYETFVEQTSKNDLYVAIVNQQIDIVTFTSSSTVENFVQLLEGTDWRSYSDRLQFVSIGPITTKTMNQLQIPVYIEAQQYTIQGMLNSMMDKLKEE